ncbi:MAG: hypothetical protein JW808_10635 [Victivallales bacterium]|nr:hypothetical protein [Victivallales bacterium]
MLGKRLNAGLFSPGRSVCALLLLLLPCCLSFASTLPASPPPLEFPEDAGKVIYYVPQFSDFQQISVHELRFLKQVLEEAKEKNVAAVIFEIDTPGGRIDVALEYVSLLLKAKVPTVAFVNPQGISAGMIVALAADRVAINPHGTIGDAMPMQMTQRGMRPVTDGEGAEPTPPSKEESGSREGAESMEPEDEEHGEAEESKEDTKDKTPSQDDHVDKKLREKMDQIKKMIDELKIVPQPDNLTPEEKKLADRKFLTSYFKVLQVLAEKNNRPVKVVRAMADPYQKLTKAEDGIEHSKVSPLTLSAMEAKELGVVDYICRSKDEIRDVLGLGDFEIVVMDKSPTQYLIYLLSHPFLSGLLIVLGVIGLYIEARTPGFGLPGSIGITAMALFFIGHAGVGNSDWIPAVIFFVGILLVALEIFVIPGFGIAGISGIIAIIASMLLAFGWSRIELAINTVGVSLVMATAGIVLLTIYVLPKSALFRRITLELSQDNADGYSSHSKPDQDLVGKEGLVHTTLRPAGLVIIDGKRLDVVAEGEFINKGEKVKVIAADGMRIIVEKV